MDGPRSRPKQADGAVVEGGFALYVHWPFCLHKCPYCDFNSHVRPRIDQARWRRALLAALERAAAGTEGRRLDSVYFGGGTPSLAEPETVAAVLERAARLWHPALDLEVTLEANPTSVEAARFRGFREAGVNRVSLGVQALDPEALRFLGRRHDVREALAAVELAASTFPRYSFDLITARPGQTPRSWRRELQAALAWVGGHISVYELTIEPGTRFDILHRTGRLVLPDEETRAAIFETTQEVLGAVGLFAYEISNHARPGEACRHNLVYWRSGDWVGIGPGAHGRLTLGARRLATFHEPRPERWLQLVEAGGSGEVVREDLAREEQVEEFLLMGLRLVEGISLERLSRIAGRPWGEVLDAAMLELLVDGGDLELAGGRLRATRQGRARLDALVPRLLAVRAEDAGCATVPLPRPDPASISGRVGA